jgi:shikimate dehydrogenase
MTLLLNGASRLFPIIGDPVKYAESPVRFSNTLAKRDFNGVCIPMEVTAHDLDTVMAALAVTANVDGILVTMPHKFTAFAHCTTSSQRSKLFQVVSVIRRNPDGTWHGDMLDGLAFVKAQKDQGAVIEGRRALLIGAGGAGSAIAAALLDETIRELVVHDVNRSRIDALLSLLGDVGEGRLSPGNPDPTGFDLIFNATPLGMEDGDPMPVDVARLSSEMFVGDVIAGHGATPFIAAAEAAGCTTANGANMVEAVQDLMADFLTGDSTG